MRRPLRPGTDRPELAATAVDSAPAMTPAAGRVSALDATRADSVGEVEEAGLPRGALLGRYIILDVLGAGGMGVVYAAYDPELDRKIALKLVRSTLAGADGRARMVREAQAIARLSHPNVVAVYDVSNHLDQQMFVAMELVEGSTLTQWLRDQPRSNRQILEVFIQAGRGLAAAHAAGLVHRDFKPDNVLVGRDGRARVVDFGLVRELPKEEPYEKVPDPKVRPSDPALSLQLTQVGAIMGTPYYMAPEQFLRGDTDARTDQYSFCVTLFEALSGKRPFEGSTLEQVSDKVLSGNVPELQASNSVAAHVKAAIRRGMSVDPEERFPSMEALLAELERDPSQVRKRWLVGGAIAASATLVTVLAVQLSRSESAPAISCDRGDEVIGQVWGPAQRAAIERAFGETHSPFSQAEQATVLRQLDAYAAAWTNTYEQSCRATHERGEQSQDLLDLRSACLQQRRTELGALVEIFEKADVTTVRRAHASVSALSPISDCDDLAGLQAPVKEPADPTARAGIAALRDELARLQAAFNARQLGLKPALESLLQRAQTLHYQPLDAEILSLLGAVLSFAGDKEEAQDVLVRAYGTAIECRHDNIAMRAAHSLIGSYAHRNQFVAARDWLAITEAQARRMGNRSTMRATVLASKGYLEMSEGKFAEAARTYEEVRAIREREEPDELPLAITLSGLAHVYDETGRYKEARETGERSLAIQIRLLGEQHPEIATVLVNLGNIADDEGNAELAVQYYNRALVIREASDDIEGKAHIFNNLGVIAFGQERYEEALAHHRKALALRETLPPSLGEATMSHTNIGDVLRRQRKYEDALAEYEKALEIAASTLGADHPYAGDAVLGIGECKLAKGDLVAASTALERALTIRREGARPIELADVEFPLARVRWAQQRRDEALALARSARKGYESEPQGKRGLDEVDRWLATTK
jgi:serine/threonine protein kinase/tetratricopeptide (TPR) repeat protein